MIKALKTRQICLFVIVFLPIMKFFMMPSVLAECADRDLWISVTVNFLIDVSTVSFALFLLKDENADFFGLIEKRFGKTVGKIFMAAYAVYFLLKTLMPVNEQKDYVEYTLYITDPHLLTFMPVFAVIFYLSLQKLRVWGRLSDGIFIIALFGYSLLFALSVPNTNPEELLPIGASGIDGVLKGSIKTQNWFGDGVYFLFFTGEYVKSKKSELKILIAYLISFLITLIFVAIFYGTFSSIAFRQKFALTEICKYTTVIDNIGRFDYFALFELLFTAIFSMAIPFYFAINLLTRLFSANKPTLVAIIVCSAAAAFHIFFDQYFVTVQNLILNVASWYFLALGSVLPIITCFLLKGAKKNEEQIG